MAKKKYIPDPKAITAGRIKRTESYAEKVRMMFAQTVNDILALTKTMPELEEGQMYSFDADTKAKQRKVEELLRRLSSAATLAIESGVKVEWEEANIEADKLIKSAFGEQGLQNTELNALFARNNAARDAFLARSEKGMNLSDRVWKSAQQLRDEMEVAITVAIGEGDSAQSISKSVRKYLNDPDLMFRRFRCKVGDEDIIDPETGEVTGTKPVYGLKWKKRVRTPDGKYHFIDYDKSSYQDEWTGKGYYKSSAQNAMRVARTETNIAYRRADHDRWQDMDFVIGQRVQLSQSHPKKDICDKLEGEYPKDFIFDGWHPQCFCFVTPIMIPEEEMAKLTQMMLKGEDWRSELKRITRGRQITDYPKGFKDWVQENEGKIMSSHDNGSDPYFIRNNFAAIKEILHPSPKELTTLEKAKIRHEARTPEQIDAIKRAAAERQKKHALIKKTANNILKVAKDYGEVDYSELQKLVDENNLTKMNAATRSLAKQISEVKKQENKLSSLIPDVHEWHKQFSMKELEGTFSAVQKKLADISGKTLAEQKKALEKEIKYVEDPTFLKPHVQYPTWKVSQSAYMSKLESVVFKIELEDVEAKLQIVKTWSVNHPKSLNVANLLSEAESSISNGETLAIIKQKANLAIAEHQKRLDEQARRDRKKSNISSAETLYDEDSFTEARKNAAPWHRKAVDANDYFFDDSVKEFWKNCSVEEKEAIARYTGGSAYITEPLRAIVNHYYQSYGYKSASITEKDVEAMTRALQRCALKEDVWIKRDAGFWDFEYVFGLRKKMGVADSDEYSVREQLIEAARNARSEYKNSDEYLNKMRAAKTSKDISALEKEAEKVFQKAIRDKLEGLKGIDRSFMSCGSCKETRFTCTGRKDVIYNIYAPKGTHGVYAQPFSTCGSFGQNWNCIDKPTVSASSENEVLLQRGQMMRITKIEYNEAKDMWYVDIEIYGQRLDKIKGYKDTSRGYYAEFE